MSNDGGASKGFPMRRTCPFAPPAGYAELREREPVSRITLPGGTVAWLLARDADVRAAWRALMSAPTRDGRGSPSRGPRARWRAAPRS